jgi:8-oxo-dGTP diphosphatase
VYMPVNTIGKPHVSTSSVNRYTSRVFVKTRVGVEPAPPAADFTKIGAVILKDHKILVAKKFGQRQEFLIPGGRQHPGETDFDTLKRELGEELQLNVDPSDIEFFDEFEERAAFEGSRMRMKVYSIRTNGDPSPDTEIRQLRWVDRNYAEQGISLGSGLSKHVIPRLVALGLM